MKRLLARLDLERQDVIVLAGLALLAGGLWQLHPALAAIVPGGLLFALGVGAFAPRPAKGGG